MNSFQGIERSIYEYLIGHANSLHSISAKTIANKNLTTTTSVNRVCKKMGYSSYTELRYKLAHELKDSTPTTSKQDQQKQLEAFVDIINKSQLIYLYSRGGSIISANYLSRFLSLANMPHLVITDIHQLTKAESGTLILISKSGETDSVVKMAQNAKRKGLKVVTISHRSSTLAQTCHLNIDLEFQANNFSIYNRESQLQTLTLIDQLGKLLLIF